MAEGKITVTLKAGQHDNPWIVVGGDSAEEINDLLNQIEASGLAASVTQVNSLLVAAQNVNAVPTTGVASAPGGAASAAAGATAATPASTAPSTTTSAEGRHCQHGPRKRYAGNGRTGAYVAWFCPLPKGHPDVCKAEFEDA